MNETQNEVTTETTDVEKPEVKKDGKIEVPEVTLDMIKQQIPILKGIVFKVGDMFFKVNYVNVGKKRFTAELINDIKAS